MGAWNVYVCIAAAVLTAACGGSVSSGQPQPATPSRDGGAGPAVSAGDVPSLEGGPARACVALDAGGREASEPMAPQYHRASGECCPADRAPGDTAMTDTIGTCMSDSDCDAGVSGRCLSDQTFYCSYDTCFSDSDCAPRTPCLCRPSPTSDSPNYCADGSECATDSDCGPGGYCSPSPSPGYTCVTANPPTYYCHTPQDECTNDSDCGLFDGGDIIYLNPFNICLYDTDRWACAFLNCALP